jgi:hypothetical protein
MTSESIYRKEVALSKAGCLAIASGWALIM